MASVIDPSDVEVLNKGSSENAEGGQENIQGTAAVELSKKLHKAILQLKGNFMQTNGTVEYQKIRESLEYQTFIKEAELLRSVDVKSLNVHERKAFFLNIYNTLTLHALAHSVTNETTVLQLKRFWQKYAYCINSLVFSLDDVEHGVLRCNQLHPTSKQHFFKEGDPRRDFVMEELDPRIHFALNCGAKSCPPIRVFSAENLEKGLELASKSFCQSETTIDMDKMKVVTSKILDWYGGDFGPDKNKIMERLLPFLTPEQETAFKQICGDFQMEFAEYDWAIH